MYTGHTCGEKLLVTAFLGSYVHHKFYYNHWGYISLLRILVLLIISSRDFLTNSNKDSKKQVSMGTPDSLFLSSQVTIENMVKNRVEHE